MDGWLPAILFNLVIFIGILVLLAGFLVFLYYGFVQTSGWKTLAQRYKVIAEPEGRKLPRQTIKVGQVRWRWCVTVILNPEGMYLQLGRQNRFLATRNHPPVFIPWAEFNLPRKGQLYFGWEAVQLSVGEPEIAAITFPLDLYKKITGYLDLSAGKGG
jgi:hypothetical protein